MTGKTKVRLGLGLSAVLYVAGMAHGIICHNAGSLLLLSAGAVGAMFFAGNSRSY